MNVIRGCQTIVLFLAVYCFSPGSANAQGFDPSAQISAAADLNNFDAVTSNLDSNQSAVRDNDTAGGEGQLDTAEAFEQSSRHSSKRGEARPNSSESGWTSKEPDWDGGVLLIESFNDKHSYIGKGDTDTFSTQSGWSFKTPIGTVIQPFVTYQWTSTGYGGPGSNHSDGYGLSLNLQQKIIPLGAINFCQAGAVENIGDTSHEPPCNEKGVLPDHFPNFDLLALLNVSYLDNNLSTLKGEWIYDTQEALMLTPGVEFDLFPKKNAFVGDPLVPSAVTIIANYADSMISGHNGESGSAGIASLSDRNTFLFPIHSESDCDATAVRAFSLIETNTLFHDTNQEPLFASTTPIAYQNWARFGLALQYSDITNLLKKQKEGTHPSRFTAPVVKVEYDYDAFNAQFQAQTVILTMNFTF